MQATTEAEKALPVILFTHGFPESWFSWRHQMKAAKEGGYRGIAPYMRGYGEPDKSKRPTETADYNCHLLCSDSNPTSYPHHSSISSAVCSERWHVTAVLGILAHIGCNKCALVGHDHGANFGWQMTLLHPNVVAIYCAMSVPYR